jgi:hypothetical protein
MRPAGRTDISASLKLVKPVFRANGREEDVMEINNKNNSPDEVTCMKTSSTHFITLPI